MQAGIAVFFQKPKKVRAAHKIQLGVLLGFRRQLMRFPGDGGVESTHFSRFRNPHDQNPAFDVGHRQFGLALAQDVDAAWTLALGKDWGTLRRFVRFALPPS